MDGRRPLAAAPFPEPGEHPAGYLRRLAIANGLGTMRQLRTATGIGALTPRSGADIRTRLADATGIEDERLAALGWTDVEGAGDRWLLVGSTPIRLQDLDLERLRHCPVCLDETRTIRTIWAVRLVTVCVRHRLRLLDECSRCGRPVTIDHRARPLGCGACGTHLAEGLRDQATRAELSIATMIGRSMGLEVAGRARAIPALDALPPGMLVAALDRLARIAMHADASPAPEAVDAIGNDRLLADAAHRMIASWPARLVALVPRLSKSFEDGAGGGVASRLDTPGGRLALAPLLDHTGHPTTVIQEPVLGALAAEHALPRLRAPGTRATGSGRRASSRSRPISHASAMQRLEGRRDEKRARWWIKAELLAEQSARDGLVTLRERDVRRMETRLARIVSPGPFEEECDLAWIDRSPACGRAYGKGELLRDVLAGNVPCRLADDAPGLAGMRFDRRAIERLRAAARLAAWKARDHHASLSAFNAVARAMWGEAGVLDMDTCDQLAAEGGTTPLRYDPPTPGARPQKRWRTADLARLAASHAGCAPAPRGSA